MAQLSNGDGPSIVPYGNSTMRGTLNPSQRTTLQDGYEYDVYVDMQWVKAGVKENDYADNPWRYPQDIVNQFLGLRISKRKQFYDALAEDDRNRIDRELQHIQEARKTFLEDDTKKCLMGELKHSRQQWKDRVQETLVEEMSDGCNAPLRETQAAEMLRQQALQHPERSPKFVEFYKKATAVNNRDQGIRKRICTAIGRNQWNSECDTREIPSDQGARQASNSEGAVGGVDRHGGTTASEPAHCGFNAGVIYFRRKESGWMGETVENGLVRGGIFPHQKLSMGDILGSETNNPLRSACDKDTIRWFHFPTNNMGWIEKALRNYAMGGMSSEGTNVSQAHNLLARKHWRGQMHDTLPEAKPGFAARSRPREHGACLHGPVHARHMRSRCSLIPRGMCHILCRGSSSITTNKGCLFVDSADSRGGYTQMPATHYSSRTHSINSPTSQNISLFVSRTPKVWPSRDREPDIIMFSCPTSTGN